MTGRKTVATKAPKKCWPQAKVDAFNKHIEAERALVDIVCMLSDDEWGTTIDLVDRGLAQALLREPKVDDEHRKHLVHCACWLANVREARRRHIEARTACQGDDRGEPTWAE